MKRITYILIAAVAVLGTSCKSDAFFKREVLNLKGVSEANLVKRFGSPDRIATKTVKEMAQAPEPLRAPIPQVLSMYPTNNPRNLDVPIKSFSWPEGRILLTVWLHQEDRQWVSFYAEEWNMDVIE